LVAMSVEAITSLMLPPSGRLAACLPVTCYAAYQAGPHTALCAGRLVSEISDKFGPVFIAGVPRFARVDLVSL
jgi:hypothetical protein